MSYCYEDRKVFNPARIAPMPGEPPKPHEAYMAKTLNVLTRLDYTDIPNRPYYDCIVMLDGWWASDGARIERAVAEAMGIEVREIDIDDGCYEVEGRNRDGRRIEVRLNPETGEQVSVDGDD